MVGRLPSSSTSETKAGTSWRCSGSAELRAPRPLLEKTMWVTSLERTQGGWAPPPGARGPGVGLGAAAGPHWAAPPTPPADGVVLSPALPPVGAPSSVKRQENQALQLHCYKGQHDSRLESLLQILFLFLVLK